MLIRVIGYYPVTFGRPVTTTRHRPESPTPRRYPERILSTRVTSTHGYPSPPPKVRLMRMATWSIGYRLPYEFVLTPALRDSSRNQERLSRFPMVTASQGGRSRCAGPIPWYQLQWMSMVLTRIFSRKFPRSDPASIAGSRRVSRRGRRRHPHPARHDRFCENLPSG